MDTTVNTASDQTKKFDGLLSTWIGVTKKGMAMARSLAEMSLIHFRDHGNTALIQKFYDAATTHGKKYVSVTGYQLWLKEYSPITKVEGKFKKAEGGTFDDEKIAKALATPFWEFNPEPVDVFFVETDIVKSLVNAAKKFHGERYKPTDEAAVKRLAEVDALLASLGTTEAVAA